jgi:hypothetical protein
MSPFVNIATGLPGSVPPIFLATKRTGSAHDSPSTKEKIEYAGTVSVVVNVTQ